MKSLNDFLSSNDINVLRTEQTFFPDGDSAQSHVFYVPLDKLRFNPKNNRFRPKEKLDDKVQSQLLRTQNPTNYNSLVESFQNLPCFEAIKVHYNNGVFEIIDGHRRFEASKDAGRTDLLAIAYEGLNQEQFDFIAEWNEENPTKLPHDSFYKARGIALPIIQATSIEEREAIIARLKRRNVKQPQIDKAVNTWLYISDFAAMVGETEEKRADQYKAFETVAQTRIDKYQTLRTLGEFDKIEKLEVIAADFLKANIAHDDIKQALDGLSERSLDDSLWIEIETKELDTSKQNDLRKIVNTIRYEKNTTDIVRDSKAFCQKIYGALLSNPNPDIVKSLKQEFEVLLEKLTLLDSASGEK